MEMTNHERADAVITLAGNLPEKGQESYLGTAQKRCSDYKYSLARGVPKRDLDAINSDKFSMDTPSMLAAREVEETRSPCIVLGGPHGIGKNVAMAYLANRWSGEYASAYEIGTTAPFEHEKMRRYMDSKLLIIDELGKMGWGKKANTISNLFAVLNHRLQGRRMTGIMTNITSEAEFSRYFGCDEGRAIWDRIRQSAVVRFFTHAKSMRDSTLEPDKVIRAKRVVWLEDHIRKNVDAEAYLNESASEQAVAAIGELQTMLRISDDQIESHVRFSRNKPALFEEMYNRLRNGEAASGLRLVSSPLSERDQQQADMARRDELLRQADELRKRAQE